LLPSTSCKSDFHFLEYGCGTGRYGLFFLDILGDKLLSYVGVDIKPSPYWANFTDDARFSFFHAASSALGQYIPAGGLVVTQSALEHFDDDVDFITTLHKNKDQVSIHLLPSTTCLFTYLWHGYRQYSIPRILRLFEPLCTDVTVFKLGGFFTSLLQSLDCYLPALLRSCHVSINRLPLYRQRLILSLWLDFYIGKYGFNIAPSFYAVVAQSSAVKSDMI